MCFCKGVVQNISIHALTRRAAHRDDQITSGQGHFNPRSHEESGMSHTSLENYLIYFNPRSHEESGVIQLRNIIDDLAFQSTLSRGERLERIFLSHGPSIFQSTLSRGERLR